MTTAAAAGGGGRAMIGPSGNWIGGVSSPGGKVVVSDSTDDQFATMLREHTRNEFVHVRATQDEVDAYCAMRALNSEKILIIKDDEIKLCEHVSPSQQIQDRLTARFGDNAEEYMTITRVDNLALIIYELRSNGMVIG